MPANIVDSIPVISQFKSLFQACCLDFKGARRTQENFSRGCPVISQLRSAAEASTGDLQAAKETQKYQAKVLEGMLQKTPVVSHMIGGALVAAGKRKKGLEYIENGTKVLITAPTAAAVGLVGGPVAAAAAGAAASVAYDGVVSGIRRKRRGVIGALFRMITGRSNAGEVFDVLFGTVGVPAAGLGLPDGGVGGEATAQVEGGATKEIVEKGASRFAAPKYGADPDTGKRRGYKRLR